MRIQAGSCTLVISLAVLFGAQCLAQNVAVLDRAGAQDPALGDQVSVLEVEMERGVLGDNEALRLSQAQNPEEAEEWEKEEEEGELIPDPIEPVNRAFFQFNDKLYFWLLKPAARGYGWVLPEPARISVRNFFTNLRMPIRAVNCLLQGKFKGFGNELLRFFVNSTAGFLGTQDVAKVGMGIPMRDEDFDQTLGKWRLGHGFYINWPIFGPSSVRGTFGLVGDYFLDPVSYVDPTLASVGVKAGDTVNKTSLMIGEYEALKEAAIDPYISLRNAYVQNRKKKIED